MKENLYELSSYLQRIGTMDQVLRATYSDMDEEYEYLSTKFITLYMPQDSDELLELY